MAKEISKVKVKAVAKIEKYDDNVSQADIKSGKAKPTETVFSEDVLIDPTLKILKEMEASGVVIPKEVWEKVQK